MTTIPSPGDVRTLTQDEIDKPHLTKRTPVLVDEMWVGYELNGRRFIDKKALSVYAQHKMLGLRSFWSDLIGPWRLMIMCTVFCQKTVVSVATLAAVSAEAVEQQYFPHETQFRTVERSDLLTRGFAHPYTLVDEADYFLRDPSFNVQRDDNDALEALPKRRALVIHFETDKRLIAFPLALALLLSAVIAVIVGVCTRDIATGAQVGGTVGGCVAVVLGYVIWRLG
ncbi:hypothetical protein LTR85_000636 [Meristemomyces frigidus]|nr:hypothetical protein LTR85_000636 [Meristemomyces frigidus]